MNEKLVLIQFVWGLRSLLLCETAAVFNAIASQFQSGIGAALNIEYKTDLYLRLRCANILKRILNMYVAHSYANIAFIH